MDMHKHFPSEGKMIAVGLSGGAGAVFTSIFGEWNDSLYALVVLMCIDFITGLIVAGLFNRSKKTANGGLSSKECLKGIARKSCTLLIVAVAYQAEVLLSVNYIRAAVIWGLCAAEIISITENAVDMDIMPPTVQKIMKKVIGLLNKDDDDKNDKE